MKFAVVTVERPSNDVDLLRGPYPSTIADIERTSPPPGDRCRPSENVWLLSLPADTRIFGEIVCHAANRKAPYQVLYFDQEPEVFDSFASAS